MEENKTEQTINEEVKEEKKENKKKAFKKEDFEKLQKENEELKDKYLRLAAEYDNFKKRTQKEKTNLYTDAVCDTIKKLLPVSDNLDRAVAFSESDENSLKEGILIIKKQLDAAFSNLNIKEIEAQDKEFNPDLHNAVMHVEDDKKGENIIVEVLQKGYEMDGKVIRYSMVKVAN